MKRSTPPSKTLATALAVAVLGALAVGVTGCSSGPLPYTPAQTTPPATLAPAASAPTAADGRAVVQQSCIGRCHGANLLNYRTSQAGAMSLASSMGRRAGLPAGKLQAVASYFAQ